MILRVKGLSSHLFIRFQIREKISFKVKAYHLSGGRVHGPVPKSYKYGLPKKVRRMGLRTALSVRYAQVQLAGC